MDLGEGEGENHLSPNKRHSVEFKGTSSRLDSSAITFITPHHHHHHRLLLPQRSGCVYNFPLIVQMSI